MTTSSTQGAAAALSPSGDLTIFEAMDFRNELVTLLSQDGPITVDLSNVKRMDCSCLQVMLAARRSGRLVVTGATGEFQARVAQVGCHGFFGG